MGHTNVRITRQAYVNNVETGRPGDALVAELLARGHLGDKSP
jgi:hypothetical protein